MELDSALNKSPPYYRYLTILPAFFHFSTVHLGGIGVVVKPDIPQLRFTCEKNKNQPSHCRNEALEELLCLPYYFWAVSSAPEDCHHTKKKIISHSSWKKNQNFCLSSLDLFFLYFCCLKIAYFALWNYWCLPTYYKKKVCYQMCLWTIHAKIWFNSPPNQSIMSWNAEKSQFWLDKYLWAWFICSTTELYPKTI